MGKEKVVWSFEYGDSAVAENVKTALTEEGLDIDIYLDFFGFPERYENIEIDPAWFTPPLPGMDQYTDYVVTMAGAEDLLDRKKREAFERDLASEDRWDGYNICLTEEEAEKYMQDESALYMFEDHSQFLYEDLLMDIEYLLDKHGNWRVDGSDMDWRGSSGYKIIEDATPQKVMDIFSCYGDYSLSCSQTEEEREAGTFTIICFHHDCPTGSLFEFNKITEEKNET